MITRRVTTRMTPEAPVGFYRTIAISFLLITIVLLGVVIFFTSKKATIVVVAKSDNKNVNLEVMIDKAGSASAVRGQVTSTLFFWSEKYFPTGNKEVDAIATGEIVIYNKSSTAQTLVKTTRFVTAEGVLFHLSDKVTAPANGQITAAVYADKAGAASNIGPSKFTVPGLSEDRQKQVYGESVKTMAGGTRKTGVLSEEDLKAAEQDFILKMKQNAVAASESAFKGEKIAAAVKDYKFISDGKAGKEVTEFTLSGTSTVALVVYNAADLNEAIDKEMRSKVDTSFEKVLSASKEPSVSVAGYDLAKGTAQLSVSQDVLVTIDANAEKFAAANFFGKKKDEIEREILGLGHVVGVEVKFSPSWMRSAPSVSDRIKVVVKNVQ